VSPSISNAHSPVFGQRGWGVALVFFSSVIDKEHTTFVTGNGVVRFNEAVQLFVIGVLRSAVIFAERIEMVLS